MSEHPLTTEQAMDAITLLLKVQDEPATTGGYQRILTDLGCTDKVKAHIVMATFQEQLNNNTLSLVPVAHLRSYDTSPYNTWSMDTAEGTTDDRKAFVQGYKDHPFAAAKLAIGYGFMRACMEALEQDRAFITRCFRSMLKKVDELTKVKPKRESASKKTKKNKRAKTV